MIRHLAAAALYISAALSANLALAQGPADLAVGEMRGLVFHDTPVPASAEPFLKMDETEGVLADYAGRYVLLNFWATWCAPCRHEMPALNTLQQTYGGEDFTVVTLATGRNPPQAIQRFFDEEGLTDLTMHRDINQQIAREMGVFGLPITVLLNPEGQEIARLRGDAEWAGEDAFALIEAVLAQEADD